MKIKPVEIKRRIMGEFDNSEHINIEYTLAELVRAVNELIELVSKEKDDKDE